MLLVFTDIIGETKHLFKKLLEPVNKHRVLHLLKIDNQLISYENKDALFSSNTQGILFDKDRKVLMCQIV